MAKRRAGLAMATLALVVGGALLLFLPHPAAAQGHELKLAVTAAPPSVIADGGAYPMIVVGLQGKDGKPRPAPSDIMVSLSSSRTAIGLIQPQLLIARGESYAVASLQTTFTPGSTDITASASGMTGGSATVTTVTPGGIPTQLAVYLGPDTLLPDKGVDASVVVQLLDSRGLPAKATIDTVVFLTSSQRGVGNVTDSTRIIPRGAASTTTAFVAGFAPGSTTITATATGLLPGSAVMKLVGPVPARLEVSITPPQVIPGEKPRLVVQLRDAEGRPAKAAAPTTVKLFSSRPDVAYPSPDQVTILEGESYSSEAVILTNLVPPPANTTIAALSGDLVTGTASISLVANGSGVYGRLVVVVGPNVVPADVDLHPDLVVVQLLNTSGFPMSRAVSTNIFLSSDKEFVGNVEPVDLTIPPGVSWGAVAFRSTFIAGSTTISAAAQGFVIGQADVTTSGATPSALVVEPIPQRVHADSAAHRGITVKLVDANGLPAKAPVPIIVNLTSASPDIGTAEATATILQGRSYTLARFTTTSTAGTTLVTAIPASALPPILPGILPGSVAVTTIEPHPSRLTVFASPANVPADRRTHAAIIVQLQDATGAPAKPQDATMLQLFSSDTGVGSLPSIATILPDSTFVKIGFNTTSRAGLATITATAPGFDTGFAKISTITYPLTAVIAATQLELYHDDGLPLVGSVTVDGQAVVGVSLTWTTSLGTVQSATQTSDASGRAQAVFLPGKPGEATITLVATKAGYTTATQQLTLTVKERPPPGPQLPVPLTVLIASAAAFPGVGIASYFFLKRRGRRRFRPTIK